MPRARKVSKGRAHQHQDRGGEGEMTQILRAGQVGLGWGKIQDTAGVRQGSGLEQFF